MKKGGNNNSANTAAAIVNFNGGTLQALQSGSIFQTATYNSPTLLAVHSGA